MNKYVNLTGSSVRAMKSAPQAEAVAVDFSELTQSLGELEGKIVIIDENMVKLGQLAINLSQEIKSGFEEMSQLPPKCPNSERANVPIPELHCKVEELLPQIKETQFLIDKLAYDFNHKIDSSKKDFVHLLQSALDASTIRLEEKILSSRRLLMGLTLLSFIMAVIMAWKH